MPNQSVWLTIQANNLEVALLEALRAALLDRDPDRYQRIKRCLMRAEARYRRRRDAELESMRVTPSA